MEEHDPDWTQLEKWVWGQIANGQVADINKRLGLEEPADPNGEDDWNDRRLTPKFLETIILTEPYCNIIPRQGVRILGAWFEKKIDLRDADIKRTLRLESSRFSADINLSRTTASRDISFDGSAISGSLVLQGADVARVMCSEVKLKRGDLVAAKVKYLDMTSAEVTRTLELNSANLGDLHCKHAKLANLNLVSAEIDNVVNLIDIRVCGEVVINSTSLGSLFMRSGHFCNPVDCTDAKIEHVVEIQGASIAGMDLTGTKMGALRLSTSQLLPTWSETATLTLSNAHADSVRGSFRENAWPSKIELDGFTYRRFGGGGAHDQTTVASRGSKWFTDWLERDKPYTPQPYYQCASVLRDMGHPTMATDVLYAGRERARKESRRGRRFGLELLKWTIGYGYGHRYFWSLYWVAVLVLLGALMLVLAGGADKIIDTYWLNPSFSQIASQVAALASYSLDLLLPIIQLHKPHYDVVLDGISRYYFFFHKTMGYVLASFLIAGLSGLTK